MDSKRLMHPKAVADRLAVSERTVIRLAHDEQQAKRFGAVRVGGQWRFNPEAVELAIGQVGQDKTIRT